MKGKRGKKLGRLRSEYVERSFAHTCETGGARRSRLRGLVNVAKRYLMYVAGRNLGVLMRALFGVGTPRGLQTAGGACSCADPGWLAVLAMRLRTHGHPTVTYVTTTSVPATSARMRCAA